MVLSKSLEVVAIGGGAAGFFGAIACASAHPHAQVTLLEAGQPLAKVRISGGGRCNVTHALFDPASLITHYPRGAKALRGSFSRFQPKDTIAWFQSRGVKLKTEADGRMFPITDSSETIVNCLLKAADEVGVKLRTGVGVKSVESLSAGFEITLKTGERMKCDRLLLATGSNPQGYAIAKSLGHTIESPVPSLFTFNIRDPRTQDLAGVSVDPVSLQLPETGIPTQTGSLLITHWGVSGPAVLKLSAWGARVLHNCRYQTSLLINWLPQYNTETLRQFLLEIKSEIPKRQVSSNCPVSLPKRLWQRLVATVGIKDEERWADLSKKTLNSLVQELIQGKYNIQGKGVFKDEFVTCGGVNLKEINFKTMESRKCAGLYFAGEILDIDGITGGFNFQSAWTTGYLAGLGIGNWELGHWALGIEERL